MAKSFNGHRSWNAWNVSLWINNDETLYRSALDMKRTYGSAEKAAPWFLALLHSAHGVTRTPDGAPYTVTTIKEAIRGME